MDAGEEISPEDLAVRLVHDAAPDTVGLTVSGGEPLHQAPALYAMICMVQAIAPHWDIGLFSGYTLGEMESGNYYCPTMPPSVLEDRAAKRLLWQHQIKDRLTWGIFGRYDRTRTSRSDRADLPWRHAVASANQDIHLFRTKWVYSDFAALMQEVTIDNTGLTTISGYAKGSR